MSKKSSSSSSSDTTVNTTTTTTIGEIGLTGNDAINALTVLEAGVIERERIGSERIEAFSDFAETLANNNARHAVTLAEAAKGADSQLLRIMPFLVGAAVLVLPAVMGKK